MQLTKKEKTMEIKSLNEIKSILAKFKNAGGVGFVIAPQLIKIAIQVGLLGYERALIRWQTNLVITETTDTDDTNKMVNGLFINYEGPSLAIIKGNNICLGIKRTIEDIELAIK